MKWGKKIYAFETWRTLKFGGWEWRQDGSLEAYVPRIYPPPGHWQLDYYSCYGLPDLGGDIFALPPGEIVRPRNAPSHRDTDDLDHEHLKDFRDSRRHYVPEVPEPPAPITPLRPTPIRPPCAARIPRSRSADFVAPAFAHRPAGLRQRPDAHALNDRRERRRTRSFASAVGRDSFRDAPLPIS